MCILPLWDKEKLEKFSLAAEKRYIYNIFIRISIYQIFIFSFLTSSSSPPPFIPSSFSPLPSLPPSHSSFPPSIHASWFLLPKYCIAYIRIKSEGFRIRKTYSWILALTLHSNIVAFVITTAIIVVVIIFSIDNNYFCYLYLSLTMSATKGFACILYLILSTILWWR